MYHVRVERQNELLTEIHMRNLSEAWNTYMWHCQHADIQNTYVALIRDTEVVEHNICYWKIAEQRQAATDIEK